MSIVNIKIFKAKTSYMKLFKEILLYVSSFIPLYFLVIVKELVEIINGNLSFNITNGIMICLNIIFIVLGVIGVVLVYKASSYKTIEVISHQNVTRENFLPYFPLFVLFALAFELEYISMAIVYLTILVLLGVVYVKNKMFYINPFLNIIGFSTYKITYKYNEKEKTKYVFSSSSIKKRNYKFNSFFVKK